LTERGNVQDSAPKLTQPLGEAALSKRGVVLSHEGIRKLLAVAA
jgi:hypothetical protein